MSNPAQHHKITYIEFTTKDIEQTKRFYSGSLGWSFQDWVQTISASARRDAGIDGGFSQSRAPRSPSQTRRRSSSSTQPT